MDCSIFFPASHTAVPLTHEIIIPRAITSTRITMIHIDNHDLLRYAFQGLDLERIRGTLRCRQLVRIPIRLFHLPGTIRSTAIISILTQIRCIRRSSRFCDDYFFTGQHIIKLCSNRYACLTGRKPILIDGVPYCVAPHGDLGTRVHTVDLVIIEPCRSCHLQHSIVQAGV